MEENGLKIKQISFEIEQINALCRKLFKEIPSFWRSTNLIQNVSPANILDLICKNNTSLLRSIRSCANDHLENDPMGNNGCPETSCSVEDIIASYSYQLKLNGNHFPNTEKLQLRLLKQLKSLQQLLLSLSPEIVCEIKRRPRVITREYLNYYDLIRLALQQSKHLLEQIVLEQEIVSMKRAKRKMELELRYQI